MQTQDNDADPGTGEQGERKDEEVNSLETLRERYTRPDSKFITLNDIPVHYVDRRASGEEDAPVIVLVHGSFLDLASYDPWVAPFKGYRVVRYDRLRWGLTGQGDGPTIDYDDEEELLAALVDHLGLKKFVLAGSSSGGMTAAAYAAHNPDRVEQLIMINFPLGHGRINSASESKGDEPKPKTITEMMDKLLHANFADPSRVTDEMVTRYGDLLNREDPTGSIQSSYKQAALLTEEARAELLGEIATPTLVMWSEANRTLPVENGRAAYDAVGAANKQFVIIEDAGHMLPLEKGELSGQVARRFVDGEQLPESVGE